MRVDSQIFRAKGLKLKSLRNKIIEGKKCWLLEKNSHDECAETKLNTQ